MRIRSTLLAATLLAGTPLAAQDDGSGGDTDEEKIALLSYLGLSAAEGKTTLGDGAGELEANILAAGMLRQAGTRIRYNLRDHAHARTIVALSNDEELGLQIYYQVKTRVEAIEFSEQLFMARFEDCKASDGPPDEVIATSEGGTPDDSPRIDAGFADLFGFLKTDREFSGIAVEPGAQMVINAIAATKDLGDGKSVTNWIVPKEIGVIIGQSAISQKVFGIFKRVSPYAAGKCDKKVDEDRAKAIKAAAGAIIANANTLVAPGKEGAPSLLEQAAPFANLDTAAAELRVLRVKVEKAGGTMMNKSNIFTTLGLNGVTMSGGLVITYRLVAPEMGSIEASGSLVCHTPMRGLKSINRNGFAASAKQSEVAICRSPGESIETALEELKAADPAAR